MVDDGIGGIAIDTLLEHLHFSRQKGLEEGVLCMAVLTRSVIFCMRILSHYPFRTYPTSVEMAASAKGTAVVYLLFLSPFCFSLMHVTSLMISRLSERKVALVLKPRILIMHGDSCLLFAWSITTLRVTV